MKTSKWARGWAVASAVSSLASLGTKFIADCYVRQTVSSIARAGGESSPVDLPGWIDYSWAMAAVLAATGFTAALMVSGSVVRPMVRITCLVLAAAAVVFLFLMV